ncbi:MAG: hypothetical protein ACOYBY_05335 [Dermatophilaceae bacterium]
MADIRTVRIGARARPQTAIWVLNGLLLFSLLVQRLQLPVLSGLPVTFVAMYVALAGLLLFGHLRVGATRLVLYLVSLSAMSLAAWASSGGQSHSTPTSLLLLLLLYLPWVFGVRAAPGGARKVGRFFVICMASFGALGFLQLVVQYAGIWKHVDFMAQMFPSQLFIEGYNTNSVMTYGSPVIKAQAFVFVEPSMFSQYLALAIIIVVLQRMHWLYLVPLVLGMVGALSGTGLLLLAGGVVIVLFARPKALARPAYILIAVTAVVLFLISPIASSMVSRTTEFSQTGSSASLRFIEPYLNALEGITEDPSRVLAGAGPGSSDRLLPSARGDAVTGQPVVYSIIPKLLFEYGAIAATFFLAFYLFSLLARGPRGLGAALAVMTFFLSGALLQPATVLLAWVLCVVWDRERPARRPDLAAASSPPTSADATGQLVHS